MTHAIKKLNIDSEKVCKNIEDILKIIIPKEERKSIKTICNNINFWKNREPIKFNYCSSENFVQNTLPYILIGFNINPNQKGPNKEGVNNLGNLYDFLAQIQNKENIMISSVLCAHKDKREKNPDMLLKELKYDQIKNVTNLIHGIFKDTPVKKTKIVFYQPTGTSTSIRSILPQIVIRYAEQGKLAELLLELDEHYQSLKEFLSKESTEKTEFTVKSIDAHINEILKEGTSRFGEKWREISERECHIWAGEDYQPAKDRLAEIAYFFAADEIKRLMPYYSNHKLISEEKKYENLKRAENTKLKDKKDLVSEVDLVIQTMNSKMSTHGKAIYEVLFYYVWGRNTRLEGDAALGFDMDHDEFQSISWAQGWNLDKKSADPKIESTGPLIYARRNDKVNNTNSLKNLSFRQLWR